MLLEAHAGQWTCEGKRVATSINHEDQSARNDGVRQSSEAESLLGVTHIREMRVTEYTTDSCSCLERLLTPPSYRPNATYLSAFASAPTCQ
jgi:hypothetical protein